MIDLTFHYTSLGDGSIVDPSNLALSIVRLEMKNLIEG